MPVEAIFIRRLESLRCCIPPERSQKFTNAASQISTNSSKGRRSVITTFSSSKGHLGPLTAERGKELDAFSWYKLNKIHDLSKKFGDLFRIFEIHDLSKKFGDLSRIFEIFKQPR
jgi:hypothetical protein